MNEDLVKLMSSLVDEAYIRQGADSLLGSGSHALTQLLIHKSLPLHPWTPLQIKVPSALSLVSWSSPPFLISW